MTGHATQDQFVWKQGLDVSVLVQEFDTGLVEARPADFTVKPKFFAFNFKNDLCIRFQVFGLCGEPAAARADVFNDAGLVYLVKLQDAGPFAVFSRKDPGFLQQFLHW